MFVFSFRSKEKLEHFSGLWKHCGLRALCLLHLVDKMSPDSTLRLSEPHLVPSTLDKVLSENCEQTQVEPCTQG